MSAATTLQRRITECRRQWFEGIIGWNYSDDTDDDDDDQQQQQPLQDSNDIHHVEEQQEEQQQHQSITPSSTDNTYTSTISTSNVVATNNNDNVSSGTITNLRDQYMHAQNEYLHQQQQERHRRQRRQQQQQQQQQRMMSLAWPSSSSSSLHDDEEVLCDICRTDVAEVYSICKGCYQKHYIGQQQQEQEQSYHRPSRGDKNDPLISRSHMVNPQNVTTRTSNTNQTLAVFDSSSTSSSAIDTTKNTNSKIWNAWMNHEQEEYQKNLGCTRWNLDWEYHHQYNHYHQNKHSNNNNNNNDTTSTVEWSTTATTTTTLQKNVFIHPSHTVTCPERLLLKRVRACIGWAIHGIIFEFVDGTRTGYVVDAPSIHDNHAIDKRKPTDWINIPSGDTIVSIEGYNLSRSCFLCHTIQLKFRSGNIIQFESNHIPWKGTHFQYVLPSNALLQYISFQDGQCIGITAVESYSHLSIYSYQRVLQLKSIQQQKFHFLQLLTYRLDHYQQYNNNNNSIASKTTTTTTTTHVAVEGQPQKQQQNDHDTTPTNSQALLLPPLGKDVWRIILFEYLSCADLL